MLDNLFDNYTRRARLYPALITLLPAFGIAVIHSKVLDINWSHAAWLAFLAASVYFLADYARYKGKLIEKKLLLKWKYFPSVTILRHTDTALSSTQTKRYHALATLIFDNITLPSTEDEAKSPDEADAVYATLSNALLTKTRDHKKYSLLLKENINYGFRRNLLGLKPIGILISTFVFILELYFSWQQISLLQYPALPDTALIVGTIIVTIIWVFTITEDYVKVAALEYAKQLLMTLETLSQD